MVHFWRRGRRFGRHRIDTALDQRRTARRTPVGSGPWRQHGVAAGTDSFHQISVACEGAHVRRAARRISYLRAGVASECTGTALKPFVLVGMGSTFACGQVIGIGMTLAFGHSVGKGATFASSVGRIFRPG